MSLRLVTLQLVDHVECRLNVIDTFLVRQAVEVVR